MRTRKHKTLPLNAQIRTGGGGSILARLFRQVCNDIGLVEEDAFDRLIARFVVKAARLPDAAKKMALRQGLSVELKKESITWKTFMRGLEFLSIKAFDLDIILEERNGNTSFHTVSSHILDDKDAGKVLADLFGVILLELKIHGDKYSACMESFIDRSKMSIHKRQKASIRAAVSKEILKSRLTWKTFIKGLLFIGVRMFTIRLRIHHQVRGTTVHVLVADIDGVDDESLEEV